MEAIVSDMSEAKPFLICYSPKLSMNDIVRESHSSVGGSDHVRHALTPRLVTDLADEVVPTQSPV